ncbi:MAG: hypothetical protein ACTILG_12370 [Sphingobacterium sp.]
MKSLADKLREASKGNVPQKADPKDVPANNESFEFTKKIKPSDTRKEVNKNNKKIQSKATKHGGVSLRISELSFDDDSSESVTIRFPKKLYSKLKLLVNEKLSIQKTTIYAVNELLESDEMKQKLKTILKSLNE